MSMVLLHSRDVQHARQTRQDKASAFRRRKDCAEYVRAMEEAADFLGLRRLARIAGKLEARVR